MADDMILNKLTTPYENRDLLDRFGTEAFCLTPIAYFIFCHACSRDCSEQYLWDMGGLFLQCPRIPRQLTELRVWIRNNLK